MSTPPTVRPVLPDEHQLVGQIVLDAYDTVGRIEGDYRAAMRDTAQRVADGAEVWVAERHGRVVGTVTFTDAGNPHFEHGGHGDCGFRMLAVAPDAQGSGTGRTLVERCIDVAAGRGRRRMVIYSMEWMAGAHALYGALGFVRRPDRDVTFPSGVGLVFQRDLVIDAGMHFPPPREVPAQPPWYLDVER